jgi:hypothetical protein
VIAIQHLTTANAIVRLHVQLDPIRYFTHLESIDLAFFGAHLLPPSRFRLRDCLHARLKFVELPPPRFHLLPHIIRPLDEPHFDFSTSLIEIQLYLAEGLETRDQVVMEHAEIREGFSFSLAVVLLINNTSDESGSRL